ncbi:UNVERIFIED_CONTAM: hypothetical protein FKN15_069428 [Acipenser sinensis]
MRYTLHINILARNSLINEGGIFDKAFSTGGIGMYKVLQKAQDSMTYSSLCLPDDIKARGVEDIPCYYYRDDGLKLWAVINRFVQSLLKCYYPNDSDVLEDTELQGWINDIFCEGFLQREESGELSSLTMLGVAFDFCAWMPNASPTMQRPPPTKKGETTMQDILQSIADVSCTVEHLAGVRLLSTTSSDFVKLGDYPEKRFTEEYPQEMIAQFQSDLKKIDNEIVHRNEDQEIGYTYMRPLLMENSAFSTGGIGMYKVLQKAQDSMTYSSLCLPDDIKARGVEDIPCYYYRDDGLKLWAVINSNVSLSCSIQSPAQLQRCPKHSSITQLVRVFITKTGSNDTAVLQLTNHGYHGNASSSD